MSRSALDFFFNSSFAGPQEPIKLPSTTANGSVVNIVSLSFTNKHLVYYWRPDAPVHMVTTNGRFYTHGAHSALTCATYTAKVSHVRFSVKCCDREFLNRENFCSS